MPLRQVRRTRVAAVSIAAAILLLLTSCSGNSTEKATNPSSASSAPYRVLVLGGVSGEGALAGNAQTSVQAAEASANVVNAAGGILGHRVQVEVGDDHGDPATAAALVRQAISSDHKPDAILNSGSSATATATLPLISQAGILSFNIGPTATSANPTSYPLNFDLTANAADQMTSIAEYLEKKRYTRVAILHSDTPYGQVYGEVAADKVGKYGLRVVGNEEYSSASADTTAQLKTLRSHSPDVILLDAYGAPLGFALRDIQSLSWVVPIVGNTSVSATNFVNLPPPSGLLGTSEVKTLVTTVLSSSVYNGDDTLVNQAVQAMLKVGPIPAALSLALNYDAIRLIRAAAVSVKSVDDPAKIAKALESSSVTESALTVIHKHYLFSASSHAPVTMPTDYSVVPLSPVINGQHHI